MLFAMAHLLDPIKLYKRNESFTDLRVRDMYKMTNNEFNRFERTARLHTVTHIYVAINDMLSSI